MVMNDCKMCGKVVVFDSDENDLFCPSCGWGQQGAILEQMEKLRGYNKTFYPRILKLAALYLLGIPISVFLIWLTIADETLNAVLLAKHGKITTARVVETKYGYFQRKSRRSYEKIPVYYNHIVFDRHRAVIGTTDKPYQVGQTFEVMYYPMDPSIFSLTAQKGDSAISIFWRDLSFLGLFSVVFTFALAVVIAFFTWTTIQRISNHKRLQTELKVFKLDA